MSNLNFTVTEFNRVDVLIVDGIVNSETSPQFNSILNERLDQNEHKNLVIDLQDVTYMSSAGLRALVSALKRARAEGGNVCLAALSMRVREVMELAGLMEVFPIYDERITAVGSF
jgi:anti-sigma B factor antagonist